MDRTWGQVKKLKLALNYPFIPVIIHFLKIPQLSKTATNSGPRVQTHAPMGEYFTFQHKKVCQEGKMVFDTYIKEGLILLGIISCQPNNVHIGGENTSKYLSIALYKNMVSNWVLNYTYGATNLLFCNPSLLLVWRTVFIIILDYLILSTIYGILTGGHTHFQF